VARGGFNPGLDREHRFPDPALALDDGVVLSLKPEVPEDVRRVINLGVKEVGDRIFEDIARSVLRPPPILLLVVVVAAAYGIPWDSARRRRRFTDIGFRVTITCILHMELSLGGVLHTPREAVFVSSYISRRSPPDPS